MLCELAVGAVMHGFSVTSIRALPDIEAKMVRLVHAGTGAELVWIDHRDENMTFAITFHTPPVDDTGVAHIVEHSVLCGSEQYPVKDPFVHLLKGSLATFLNAWTASDSTTYPVSTRNRRDFLNLIDVYVDAVLHPLSVKKSLAFRQEGWHWEKDGARYRRNGIVYSEMKGALANPLRQADIELSRLLFRDNEYRFVAGGDPAAMGALTFEGYCDFYRRYYHPSNARIFLDGDVDLDAVLVLLEKAFAGYGRQPLPPRPRPVAPAFAARTLAYPLSEGESPEGRTIVADGYLACAYDDLEERFALKVLCEALAGAIEDPLPQALVAGGLCDDVDLSVDCHSQAYVTMLAENVRDGKTEELRRKAAAVFERAAREGVDRRRLRGIIARSEFSFRERDSGSMPRGIIYLLAATDQWLYGGDPAAHFEVSGIFRRLRENLDGDYWERLLRKTLIDNPARAEVTLTPDPQLTAERVRQSEREEDAVVAAWTPAERERIAAEAAELAAWQNAGDDPAAVAVLPRLRPGDISPEPALPRFTRSVDAATGTEVCLVHSSAPGIVYVNLLIPLGRLENEEYAEAELLADLIGELPTENFGASELRNEINCSLGRFGVGIEFVSVDRRPDAPARGFLEVRTSALADRVSEIRRLLPEILLRTRFDDVSRIGEMLRQERITAEQSCTGISGSDCAARRALAMISPASAAGEMLRGVPALRRWQQLDDDFARDGAAIAARLGKLARRIVQGGPIAVIASDGVDAAWAIELAKSFPRTDAACTVDAPLPKRETVFVAPGEVGAAACAMAVGGFTGSDLVAARLLSLDYLWPEIRVRGGAYGSRLTAAISGLACFSSWNDPSPRRSFDVYRDAAAALRRLAGLADIGNAIIGTVAKLDPYQSPSAEVNLVDNLVMAGRTVEEVRRTRRELLATDAQSLRGYADRLERSADNCVRIVVAGAKSAEGCAELIPDREVLLARPER